MLVLLVLLGLSVLSILRLFLSGQLWSIFEPIKSQPIQLFYLLCLPLKRRIGCARGKKCVRIKKRDFHSHIGALIYGIIAAISLLIYTIPQKQSLNDTWVKFCALVFMEMNKRNTTKDSRQKHKYRG